MVNYYMGIDVGSVSTNIVLIDEENNLVYKRYLRTQGKPLVILQDGIREVAEELGHSNIAGVGTTGSGRYLASVLIGADVVKNEITCHAIAALDYNPETRTVLEIGGQDSKIIIIRDGIVVDFAMNTVCAAGTGSFLDRQALRLGMDISEFGNIALNSKNPVRIAGRCAVFAESDMIHKQQLGHNQEDIVSGLCNALVRNYLSNVAKGKDLKPVILFQGGVAANKGIRKAFEDQLSQKIHVPTHYDVMGAIGAAILSKEVVKDRGESRFKGFDIYKRDYRVSPIDCNGCSNICEILEIREDDKILARYGDKCGKWSL
mgnify:FL=1